MAAPDNGSRRFEVDGSGSVVAAIRRVHREASRQGRGPLVTKILRRLIRRMESDPFAVGEPEYRLPALRLQVRTVVVAPVVLHFAICEDRPLVFIKGIKLFPPAQS